MKTVARLEGIESRLSSNRRRSQRAAGAVASLVEQGQLIGWREWVSLPGLGIDWIRAKIDTGARTSALHAVEIRPFDESGEEWVSFIARPHSGGALDRSKVPCRARLVGIRPVKNSGGIAEHRHVVLTPIVVGNKRFDIEITLTNRAEMGHEMLFGRSALRKGRFLVHPSSSYLQSETLPSHKRISE